MKSSFLNRIRYKQERIGIVEKDGKPYVKYVKVRRFKVSKNVEHIVLSGLILIVLGLGVKLLVYELSLSEPVTEELAE